MALRFRRATGVFRGASWWSSGGLIVAGGVEQELADDLTGGSVDDGDVEVLDQEPNVGSGVGSPDADVVESAVVSDGDGTGFVDAVVSDPVVGVGVAGLPG